MGITAWLEPRAGFYLWCRLPDGRDAADAARFALEQRVVLASGNVFSISQTARHWMRFNVSQMGDAKVLTCLRQALDAPTV